METKPKLAMIISTFYVGGGQKVVLDLLKSVDREKFDVKLFVHTAPVDNQFTRELKKIKIPVVFVNKENKVTIKNYKWLSKELKQFSPDILHIHLDTFYAPIWALLHKTKTIFTVHSQAHRAFHSRFYVKLHRFLARHRRYFITAVSDTIAAETEKILNLSPGNVQVVYNPVEIKEFVERREFSEVNFVNVARFDNVKNHKLLLKAFKSVVKEIANAKLSLAGDGPLMQECLNYAKELQIDEYVCFLGNVTDIDSLLKASDVFVLSSDSEALPISILEAMAHGLPIVSTAVGGVPDIVGENGLLVPKGDSDALSTAMIKMADSYQFRSECGKKSYELVQRFKIENVIHKYEELYLLS